jgi:CheY-like chemotaxis protein
MNLVVNARDAMPTGGRLTIETSNVVLDEDYAARHVAVKPGPYVHLAITDTGCGMDEATKARIFEPFFTTKGVGKGTGLGLSTVYGIVKQSGGNIWVYSEPGHGTTFRIYLPRTRSLATTDLTLKAVVTDTGGTETVMIVEDEEAIRGITSRILGKAGYTVLVFSSAKDALAACKTHDAKIHLLLTDVVMPGMGGRALAEEMEALRPGIKVLYMSGYTDETIAHHGALVPGTHFIAKPFNASTLTRKVREVLDSDNARTLDVQQPPVGPELGMENSPPGRDALRAVSPQIKDSLRKAVRAAQFHEVLDLVDLIRSTDPDLAGRLRQLVLAYDYDALLDLLGLPS